MPLKLKFINSNKIGSYREISWPKCLIVMFMSLSNSLSIFLIYKHLLCAQKTLTFNFNIYPCPMSWMHVSFHAKLLSRDWCSAYRVLEHTAGSCTSLPLTYSSLYMCVSEQLLHWIPCVPAKRWAPIYPDTPSVNVSLEGKWEWDGTRDTGDGDKTGFWSSLLYSREKIQVNKG